MKFLFLLLILVINVNAVYISEVYYDPSGSEVNNEFIELFIDDSILNLSHWVITTFDNDNYTLPYISDLSYSNFVIIIPGQGIDDLDATDGIATIYLNRGISILSNSGDEIGLFNNKGEIIDFIRYEGGNGDSVLENWSVNDLGITANGEESIQITGDDFDSSNNWISAEPTLGYFYFVNNEPFFIIKPEAFTPRIYFDPTSRIIYDDNTEPGAINNTDLIERQQNYAFEGERIEWQVLVWDKNSDDKISDVYLTVQNTTDVTAFGDYVEVDCYGTSTIGLGNLSGLIFESEEEVTWNDDTMDWYKCELTIEGHLNGEHWITAVAEDINDLIGVADEKELWFLNPIVSLESMGSISFGEVRPGETFKSSTLTISNGAEQNSGVMLDMFIAGTDFYDLNNGRVLCPTSNVLSLTNFMYFARSGSYSSCQNNAADAECYDNIPYYMTGAANPGNNNMKRIIDDSVPLLFGEYPLGNLLSPGAEISLNFKVALPEPCNGNLFSDGTIKILGEAV